MAFGPRRQARPDMRAGAARELQRSQPPAAKAHTQLILIDITPAGAAFAALPPPSLMVVCGAAKRCRIKFAGKAYV